MKIAIIGSGVSGMFTAWMLGDKADEIVIFDKKQAGQESSWAGGGIISPLYPWRYADSVTQLAKASQAMFPDLMKEIGMESGIDPEYLNSGLLVFSSDEKAEAEAWAQRWSVGIESVGQDGIGELEPGLVAPEYDALWLPGVCQVRNPKLVKSIYTALKNRPNVRFVLEEAVDKIESLPSGEVALETAEKRQVFDKAILCAGAWTPLLLEHSPLKPDIKPIRGQMLLFHAKPGDVKRITLHENHYAIPRKDGRVLFGSTIEDTGFVKETTSEARHKLFALAVQLYPALSETAVEHHWAGLRPSSPEGIPYIGPCPNVENMYINAGHFRNGIVLGPASAKLVADLVLDEKTSVDPAPYTLQAERKSTQPVAPEQTA